MDVYVLWNIVIPIVVALCCGVLSSFMWAIITRRVCFPIIDVDKNITIASNGDKTIKIKNKHRKYGAYDINCYCEYVFTYKNRRLRYSLQTRFVPYIKALGEAEVLVNLPIREFVNNDGDKESFSNAFYQSTDGKLYVKIICKNRYGIKRSIPKTYVVEREIENLSER